MENKLAWILDVLSRMLKMYEVVSYFSLARARMPPQRQQVASSSCENCIYLFHFFRSKKNYVCTRAIQHPGKCVELRLGSPTWRWTCAPSLLEWYARHRRRWHQSSAKMEIIISSWLHRKVDLASGCSATTCVGACFPLYLIRRDHFAAIWLSSAPQNHRKKN